MSNIVRNTVMAAAVAASTLAMTAGAFAQDPTQGRIQARETARNQQYFKCAEFSLHVYNACLGQAGNNSSKIRSCRTHYQDNLGRCRAAS